MLKALYMSIWLYYMPFLAPTINFSAPFLADFVGGYVDDGPPAEMSAE